MSHITTDNLELCVSTYASRFRYSIIPGHGDGCAWTREPVHQCTFSAIDSAIVEFIQDMRPVFPEFEAHWSELINQTRDISEQFAACLFDHQLNIVTPWRVGRPGVPFLGSVSYRDIVNCPNVSQNTIDAFHSHIERIHKLFEPIAALLQTYLKSRILMKRSKAEKRARKTPVDGKNNPDEQQNQEHDNSTRRCNILSTTKYKKEFVLFQTMLDDIEADESNMSETTRWGVRTIFRSFLTTHTDIVVEFLDIIDYVGLSVEILTNLETNQAILTRMMRSIATNSTKRQAIQDKLTHWSRYFTDEYLPWGKELSRKWNNSAAEESNDCPSIQTLIADVRSAIQMTAILELLNVLNIPIEEIMELITKFEIAMLKSNGVTTEMTSELTTYIGTIAKRMFDMFTAKFSGGADNANTNEANVDAMPESAFGDSKIHAIRERLRAKINRKRNATKAVSVPVVQGPDLSVEEWLVEIEKTNTLTKRK